MLPNQNQSAQGININGITDLPILRQMLDMQTAAKKARDDKYESEKSQVLATSANIEVKYSLDIANIEAATKQINAQIANVQSAKEDV